MESYHRGQSEMVRPRHLDAHPRPLVPLAALHRLYLKQVTVMLSAKEDPMRREAMLEEMKALEKNKTWELVDLPLAYPEGKVERYKACLVAKGYTQTYGIDYEETFAPVAKMNSIRTLISCAANLNWVIYQMDVKNAFLHCDLHEEAYMHIPPSFETGTSVASFLVWLEAIT
ncbi:hypothetical protein U9M48_031991 [Paspalum notatum var. saurae]|uniref:Reverse transcriptase Ty1/copia-type domain-containing protein n=1 Tax=Paspalum notatum var. saurae TaxID=547442 RepID=A0AAQ3U4E0_PASNO